MFCRSLAVWKFVEEIFWHPKWCESERRYAPSQVVTPNIDQKSNDFGKVVAVQSVYTNVDIELMNGYNPTQVRLTPNNSMVNGNFNK